MFSQKFCVKILDSVFLMFFATVAMPMASRIPRVQYIPTAAQLGFDQQKDVSVLPEALPVQMSPNNIRGLQSEFLALRNQPVQQQIWTTQEMIPFYVEQLKFARAGAATGMFKSTSPYLMSRQEAAYTLGVSQDASPEQIKSAYRQAALKAHPDAGGSTKAMQNINDAKAILLKEQMTGSAVNDHDSFKNRDKHDSKNERQSTGTKRQETSWYDSEEGQQVLRRMEKQAEELRKMNEFFKAWGTKQQDTSWSSKFLAWKRAREHQRKERQEQSKRARERQQKERLDELIKNWGKKQKDNSVYSKFYSWFKK